MDDNGHSPISHEIALLGYIDRFGVMAVLGRPVLSYGEIRRMIAAENIFTAYKSRQASDNWGKWALENQKSDALLKSVEVLINAIS